MPTNSALYIAFLLFGVGIYWVAPVRFRKSILLLLSVLFYAYYSVGNLVLLLLITAFTYAAAQLLLKLKRLRTLLFSVAVLVLGLCAFKYLSQIPLASLRAFDLVMPLGMSYFTFEFISLLTDIYRGSIKSCSFSNICTYGLFFPARSAGPIKRFDHFVAQLSTPKMEPKYLYYGLLFLLMGYAQKIIIADPLVPFTNALQDPANFTSAFDGLVHLYAYSIRIYADFAGLSNIAIGSALLFGIVIPKNFESPYLQANIAMFWRKWHMSLSDWARDYIYIPLGGNRASLMRSLFNLVAVMFIIGIWHGSTSNFAVWGLWHGAGLVVHRLWTLSGLRMNKLLGIFITFHFVTLGWAFFVTSSFATSIDILRTLLL